MPKLPKAARNAIVADVALAFARDRLASKLPGVQPPRRRRPSAKALLLGGAAVAVGAALLLKRDKVVGLLPGRTSEPGPPPPAPQATPPISNYDAPGPVANTATAVPTPPPHMPPAIDEAAEEAAAAAEAANIGGQVSDYAGGEFGESADESERPLMEAGEGEAEGLEQADAELESAAESTEPGESPAQQQIEDVLDSPPQERAEPLVSEDRPGEDSEFRTWSGRSINP